MVPVNQWIKIKAPATVANMVCGFDILGFAVNNPYDEMEMRLIQRSAGQAAITIINIDDYNLPTNPEKNVAGAALIALIEEYTANSIIEKSLSEEYEITSDSAAKNDLIDFSIIGF
ncbi:MAG: hypothetical protein RLZ95_882, partial [Bacteroidota bacterium]